MTKEKQEVRNKQKTVKSRNHQMLHDRDEYFAFGAGLMVFCLSHSSDVFLQANLFFLIQNSVIFFFSIYTDLIN